MTDAPLLVGLANAGRSRRPAGTPEPVREDPFENARSATRMLRPFLGRAVVKDELDGVRRLASETGKLADALVNGEAPPLHVLNRLAAESLGHAQLRVGQTGALEAGVVWGPGHAAAILARRVVDELGRIDTHRLRRCARAECDLIFYDVSRSGTQRWHSEDPCGWRERQRKRRLGTQAEAA